MSTIYYSKYDLANLLKLSVSTIDNKMKAGEIEYYKIGKSVRFDESMVNEFEDENAPIDHVARARENARIEGFTR